jgi:hypothetical protein
MKEEKKMLTKEKRKSIKELEDKIIQLEKELSKKEEPRREVRKRRVPLEGKWSYDGSSISGGKLYDRHQSVYFDDLDDF